MTLVRIPAKIPHYIDPAEIVHVCASDDRRQQATLVYLRNGHSFQVAMAVDDFMREVLGEPAL